MFCLRISEQTVNISLHFQANIELVPKTPSSHFVISHAAFIFKFHKNQPSFSNVKEIIFVLILHFNIEENKNSAVFNSIHCCSKF